MAFGCGAMAFQGVGIKLQIADYWSGVEIEAPLDGSTPVEIQASPIIYILAPLNPPRTARRPQEKDAAEAAKRAAEMGSPDDAAQLDQM